MTTELWHNNIQPQIDRLGLKLEDGELDALHRATQLIELAEQASELGEDQVALILRAGAVDCIVHGYQQRHYELLGHAGWTVGYGLDHPDEADAWREDFLAKRGWWLKHTSH